MNAYLQQIYRDRCQAAENAAQRVQERHQAILDRWRRMANEGVLYTSTQRQVDSDALQEASEQFRLILASVYEIEDAERE